MNWTNLLTQVEKSNLLIGTGEFQSLRNGDCCSCLIGAAIKEISDEDWEEFLNLFTKVPKNLGSIEYDAQLQRLRNNFLSFRGLIEPGEMWIDYAYIFDDLARDNNLIGQTFHSATPFLKQELLGTE